MNLRLVEDFNAFDEFYFLSVCGERIDHLLDLLKFLDQLVNLMP